MLEAANFDLIIFDCDGVLVDSEVISCRAHARCADAARLSDHHRAGAGPLPRRIRARRAADGRTGDRPQPSRRSREPGECGRRCNSMPSDLQPITHVAAAIGAIDLPKCVASSGTPEKIRHGLTCAGLYDLLAPNIFSATPGRTRQARARSVPVCRRADECRAGAVPRDRGQRPRRDRRACRRDDRAGLSRRQPLPAGPRREAAGRRRRIDVRRYAAIAGAGPAGRGGHPGGLIPASIVIPRRCATPRTRNFVPKPLDPGSRLRAPRNDVRERPIAGFSPPPAYI